MTKTGACSKEEVPYPAYLRLLESGELRQRAAEAVQTLAACGVCPRLCRANRLGGDPGVCRIGRRARVASYFPHLGEEACLRGWRGSGTVFFSGCNLRCVFCQNWEISQGGAGVEVSAEGLADMMLELQAAGCHNINWVTPEHVVPQALEALALAAEQGLRLPVVYNTSAFDSLATLSWLAGVVDLYMPDFKYWDADVAQQLSGARDYPEVARQAIRAMHRQVGDLELDRQGLARRGLLVRHLVLPQGLAGTGEVAAWLAQELSPDTYVNLMDQYHPDGAVLTNHNRTRYPGLGRPLTTDEFEAAKQEARHAGLWRFDASF